MAAAKVLVVDDSAFMRKVISDIINQSLIWRLLALPGMAMML
ncbi:hypothetical protein [Syntrophomonas palmitatica]